jgi:hypothetical protein
MCQADPSVAPPPPLGRLAPRGARQNDAQIQTTRRSPERCVYLKNDRSIAPLIRLAEARIFEFFLSKFWAMVRKPLGTDI